MAEVGGEGKRKSDYDTTFSRGRRTEDGRRRDNGVAAKGDQCQETGDKQERRDASEGSL
jgi:hypothetical protein